MMRMQAAEDLIRAEYYDAAGRFEPFNSEHEGIAVIREEYAELEREVFRSPRQRDRAALEKEAKQLGAMALRFLIDCCP